MYLNIDAHSKRFEFRVVIFILPALRSIQKFRMAVCALKLSVILDAEIVPVGAVNKRKLDRSVCVIATAP